jgi:glutamine phosphoribosylpyrophosphate amidotransferase
MQLAQRLGIPYREGFVKNRYIGRTFIMPGQAMRKKSVRQKLNTVGQEFKGKRVLLVDDSIVRGTTSREIVEMARAAGALKVYFASARPPVRYPNVYGIDMPTRGELIATDRNDEEIAREIGADALVYQDHRSPQAVGAHRSRPSLLLRCLLFRWLLHHRRHHAPSTSTRSRPPAMASPKKDSEDGGASQQMHLNLMSAE